MPMLHLEIFCQIWLIHSSCIIILSYREMKETATLFCKVAICIMIRLLRLRNCHFILIWDNVRAEIKHKWASSFLHGKQEAIIEFCSFFFPKEIIHHRAKISISGPTMFHPLPTQTSVQAILCLGLR